MPVFYDQNEEDKKKQQQQQSGNTSVISGGSTTVGAGGSAGGTKGGPTKSGRWTNLDDYVNANQANNQTLGKIENSLTKENQSAQQSWQNQSDVYKNEVNSSGVIRNDEAVKNTVNQAAFGNTASPSKTSNLQNPLDGVSLEGPRPESLTPYGSRSSAAPVMGQQQFKDYANAQYQGPNSFNDSQDNRNALNQVAQVQQKGQMLGNESGRFSLLNDYFNKSGGYSHGKKTLDNLLLTRDSRTQDLSNQYKGVRDALDPQVEQLNQLAQDRKTQTQEATAFANQYLGDTTNQVGQQGQQRADQRLAQLDQDLASWQPLLNNPHSSDFNGVSFNGQALDSSEALKQYLGLEAGNSSYLNGAGGYLNSVIPTQVTGDSARTPEEVAALQSLAGLGGDIEGYNFDVAGTYDDEDLMSFDNSRFSQDSQASAKAMNDQLAAFRVAPEGWESPGFNDELSGKTYEEAVQYMDHVKNRVASYTYLPEYVKQQTATINRDMARLKRMQDDIKYNHGHQNKIKV